mgnify:CR=1 FL=1
MTQYYIRRKDAETKMNKWCTDNGKEFVPYNGTYEFAMKMKVPLFDENGNLEADVI